MLMGFVGIKSIGWFGGNGLYVIFMVISGMASYAGFTMPFCTGNRQI